MNKVKCSKCRTVIGESDGRVFFSEGRPVNQLVCDCGAVRKLFGAKRKPRAVSYEVVALNLFLA